MLVGGEPRAAFRLGVAGDAYDISTQGDGLTTEMSNTLDAIRSDIADGPAGYLGTLIRSEI